MWATWNFKHISKLSFPDSFKGALAKTNSTGHFHFSGLPPGKIEIASKRDGLKPPAKPVEVQLQTGEARQAKVIMIGRLEMPKGLGESRNLDPAIL